MKRRNADTKIARIFEDVGGYHLCDDNGSLSTSNYPYKTKASAMEAAVREGYRFAIGSGTYWGNKVKAIPEFIRARAR